MFAVLYVIEELKIDTLFTPSSIFDVTIEAVQLWSFSSVSPFVSLQKE